MAEQGVRFVRIHGRVVPIREGGSSEKKRNKRIEGGAAVASGIGVAVGAGHLSAKAESEAHIHSTMSKGFRSKARESYRAAFKMDAGKQLDLFAPVERRKAAQFFNQAVNHKAEAMRFSVAAKNIRKGGLAASATLVTVGTNKLLPERLKKEHKVTAGAISGGAGITSAFLIRSAYLRRAGAGMKTWSAVKLAAKRVMSRGMKL